MKKYALFGTLCCLLASCASYGPPAIITADGPVPQITANGYHGRFARSVKDAEGESFNAEDNSNDIKLVRTPAEPEKIDAMLEDGITLIYANCSDFFRASGQRQSRLMVWRDAISLTGALIAGTMAIDGSGNNDALAIVTLGSAGAMSGIDLYTQHYLFGAENVDSVRELTLKALSAHADGVRTLRPPTTYQEATIHLLDNQAICTPSRIALLTREAIQQGKVVPDVPTDALDTVTATADHAILKRLGAKLNPPVPLSLSTAGAYYWLLFGEASPDEIQQNIRPALRVIPPPNNPFEQSGIGVLKNRIPQEDLIEHELLKLSDKTRDKFKQAINNVRASPPSTKGSVADGGVSPTTEFKVAPLSEARTSGVSVRIRVE
ncbi:hypothetical protein [Xanthomonas graminis]|nr:hypothetical protein [Xanthomonas translucens]